MFNWFFLFLYWCFLEKGRNIGLLFKNLYWRISEKVINGLLVLISPQCGRGLQCSGCCGYGLAGSLYQPFTIFVTLHDLVDPLDRITFMCGSWTGLPQSYLFLLPFFPSLFFIFFTSQSIYLTIYLYFQPLFPIFNSVSIHFPFPCVNPCFHSFSCAFLCFLLINFLFPLLQLHRQTAEV